MSNRTTTHINTDHNGLKQAEASLPASWYYDPQHYQQELDKIWGRSWLYLGRASALEGAWSYKTMEIGDQSVFVMRTDQDQIVGYFNACRHRGSILFKAPQGRLRNKAITCPYHQWCYSGTDGKLLSTTSFCDPKGFDKGQHGLFPIAVKVWRGFVFVNLDAGAVWDKAEVFARDSDSVSSFPMEDLKVGYSWSKRVLCNWKVFWENFNECLHCPNVHPSLVKMVPIYGRRISGAKDHPDWVDHQDDLDPKYRGGLRAGADSWSKDGRALPHRFEGLSAEAVARGQTFVTTLPSAYLVGHVDYVRIVQLLPQGPEETLITAEWLFPEETLADPGFDHTNISDFAKTVMMEDAGACELNQTGLHAAPFTSGVLMPEEHYVKAFQDWLREKLAL